MHSDGTAITLKLKHFCHAGLDAATERYAQEMPSAIAESALVLVLDTCGERASVALFAGAQVLAEAVLEERSASSTLLAAIRDLLRSEGLVPKDLTGVGVVNGPGSFTGVRVGLAMAKGLCQAAGLSVAAVSRLAVLAQAATLQQGFALLGAGREQVYVRALHESALEGTETAEPEFLADLGEFEPRLASADIAVASPALASRLAGSARNVRLVELSAKHAFGAVRACFARGGSDLATVDANYVRNEDRIYRQAAERAKLSHA